MKRTIDSNIILIFLLLTTSFSCSQQESESHPLQECHISINGETIEMVLVEGGTFDMGCTPEQEKDASENEKPAHSETVQSFYIGKYEVTQKLWNAVLGNENNHSYNTGCEDCPVENVSWDDVQAFIARLTILTQKKFRLPSDIEWEYAARGGTRSKGYKYSGSNNINEVGWYIENYQDKPCGEKKTTHAVGLKQSNELGLYDMSGNVWEWCNNLYQKEYIQNDKEVHTGWPFPGTHLYFRRILRGGSWGGEAIGCRVSYIDYDFDKYKDEYGGFRLVLEADEKQ